MSVRATFVSFVMRHTIKRRFANVEDPKAFRDWMASQRLTAEPPAEVIAEPVDAGGVPAEWVTWPGEAEGGALLYLHGGGYVFGSPESHRDIAWRLAKEADVRVLNVDYRLAPEHQFPCAVEDATTAYRFLLDQGYTAKQIAVAGDSAGGGLTAALLVNIKNQGLEQPRCAVLMSPWTDLAATGESVELNAKADPMISPGALKRMAGFYLGERDPTAPLASPLYADLSDLCPLMVIVGSTEVLLSDATRLVTRVQEAGGEANLKVWDKMPHVFPVFAARIPEGKVALTEIAEFLRR